LFLGDAKEYIKSFEDEKFDIVFQDAFSPLKNRELWTKEYFGEIKRVMKKDAVLTTYSTALPVRLGLYENGFHLYVNSGDGFRDSTIASFCDLDGFKKVNMEHKIKCNPHVKYF
jgi:tRNA U34 5-methylaminomethyl-2-thiouridine-forming methyltransferase MnmC